MEKNKDDLSLKEIGHYTGTSRYYKMPLFNSNLTEGIMYVATNGYTWFITDALSVLEHHPKVKDEPFKTVKLEVNAKDKTAKMIITDGNTTTLYTQKYLLTNAKVNITLFHCQGVLMLDREY